MCLSVLCFFCSSSPPQAFTQALDSANVSLVTWLAYLSLAQKEIKDIVPALSPAVQLCMVQ